MAGLKEKISFLNHYHLHYRRPKTFIPPGLYKILGAFRASASEQLGAKHPDRMAKSDVENKLRTLKRNTESIDDQISILHAKRDNGIGPNHDGLKANEVEAELDLDLDYAVRTSLSHIEEVDFVEEFRPPGPDTLVIATWMDNGEGEVVLGRVGEAAEEGLEALASEVETTPPGSSGVTAADGSGATVRSVVAAEFDLVPNKVENYLRTTDKPVEVLNRAVEAIEEDDKVDKSEDYGEIAFINMPYRYRLTEKAVQFYEK